MKIVCRERSSSAIFEYQPFEFALDDVISVADRSSAETDFTLVELNDGTRHLIDMYYLALIAKMKEAGCYLK